MTTGAELRTYLLGQLDGFAREAQGILDMVERGEGATPGIRIVAELLQQRDMARNLEAWIEGVLRDETFTVETTRVLEGTKIILTQLEGATLVAIALGGSDHPDTDWWARHAGERAAAVLALVDEIAAIRD